MGVKTPLLSPISTEPGLPGLVGQSYSIEEIISKCIMDGQGNNKGYFTKDEWMVRLLLLPNERWTEDQAEQTFYQLLQEGKLTEIEQGRFKPTV
jgi:hypothetical protein